MPAPVVAAAAASGASAGGAGVAGAGGSAGAAGAQGGAAAAREAASAGAQQAAAGQQAALRQALRTADYGSRMWERRDQLLKILLGLAGLLTLLVMLPVLAMMTIISMLSGEMQTQTTRIGTGGGVPAVYLPMYSAAADYYKVNAFALAALHSTESTYSRNDSAFTPNSAGAIGPMQFLPSTWSGYADAYKPIAARRPKDYPRSCQPHGCIRDDFDAIAAAAAYLKHLGAGPRLDDKTLKALSYYKGRPPYSLPDARKAYNLALSLQAANIGAAPSGPVPTPAGPVMTRIISLANWIDAQNYHYCFGGGHVQPAKPSATGDWCVNDAGQHVSGNAYLGLDCSASVSMLLQRAGFDVTTRPSGGFVDWGDPGHGKRVTIWANNTHVFMEIDRRFWGTSNGNFASGPGWGPQTTVGFTPRHPPGL